MSRRETLFLLGRYKRYPRWLLLLYETPFGLGFRQLLILSSTGVELVYFVHDYLLTPDSDSWRLLG